MGALGNAYRDKVLDAILGGSKAPNMPANVYVALYTVTPTGAGGGTEVAVGGYARVAVPNDVSHWPNAAGNTKTNGLAVTFNEATAPWGTVVAFGIHDHPTNDSLVGFGALTTSRAVNTGETPQWAPGQLGVTA